MILCLNEIASYSLELNKLAEGQSTSQKYEEELDKLVKKLNIKMPYYVLHADDNKAIIAIIDDENYDYRVNLKNHKEIITTKENMDNDLAILDGNQRYFKYLLDKKNIDNWDVSKYEENKVTCYISKV